jgi:hypothetical protein
MEGFADGTAILTVYSVQNISGMADKAAEVLGSVGLGDDNLYFDIGEKLAKIFTVESLPVTFLFDIDCNLRDYKKGFVGKDEILAMKYSIAR